MDHMDQYLHYRSPRRRREKRAENLFREIMAENFPNLDKKKKSRSRKSRDPNQKTLNKHTPRHIIINVSKLKTRRES